MESMGLKNSFWKGKKVFITGHSGFKGSWASYVLHMLGANVKGYSLKPDSESNLFDTLNLSNLIYSDFQDIRDKENLMRSIQEFNPDIIFHMAAQPLVRDSYNDPIYTYEVNVIGILEKFEKQNYHISLPKIEKNSQMNFFRWSTKDPLTINKFGIPEPVSPKILYPDILLVPLVGYDNNLNRLGYGGGFYDRYIEKIDKIKKVTKIGLAFSYQKIKSVPIDQYDKKLDFIITEKEIIK